ncbi:glycerophosphoryl diester phosphodiesterase [Enterovibrio nigricans]|uniref:Glycerophosphoryl diester phosphodiesterase n=1 Tax=Enterovibrio nigricans DSM 22720 TaxID=1121868 RepID=A0A1T4USJ3_9GAMM|nr:glycerophosphoryl diester phosphodiesterase [Enterovibrio nigricans]PKF50790.1 glycerophosphoryl diester phosphodiesterase [Enterovibrio nigricans]SKA55709.1 glycerophosphoryl diester phosphodiesterase [Enterovibrio nigricans DSM 22720]
MKTLFAHRGMSSLAPENTLAAFSLVKEHGLTWIECDVDVLADGTIVVSHDDTLDRCTDRTGSLYDLTREDLEDIDAGSWFADDFIGERIPTFGQLIALVNVHKLNINVEIKSCTAGMAMTEKLIDGVIKGLENLSDDCDLLVSSFNPLALAEFKRRSPETAVACLFEKETLQPDWLSILQACGADAIHVEDTSVTKERVIAMKEQGFMVNVYTVNNLARANQLFNWGVDGVFTDIGQSFPSRYRPAR